MHRGAGLGLALLLAFWRAEQTRYTLAYAQQGALDASLQEVRSQIDMTDAQLQAGLAAAFASFTSEAEARQDALQTSLQSGQADLQSLVQGLQAASGCRRRTSS